MSTVTHRHETSSSSSARKSPLSSERRRPYFVINGATMVAIAAIALTVIGLLYLIQTSEVAQLGYDLTRLQAQRDVLTLEVSELEYELARYESLQTVEQMAVTRLGMAPMTNYEFFQIQEPSSRNLTIPEPAQRDAPSITERILDAFLGVGSAESESADMSRYTLGEQLR